MAPRSSITKRWLLNSFGIIVVIMVAMVIGVSAAMHSFYYNSASQYIRTRAAAVSARLESAAADAGSDFNARLYELVQDFEYRDRIELMAIDSEGTVFLTSSGFLPQDTAMPDLADSRTNGGIGSFTGRWDGQKIMAVTVLSSLSGEDLLGLRYVVSMQAIDPAADPHHGIRFAGGAGHSAVCAVYQQLLHEFHHRAGGRGEPNRPADRPRRL